MVAPDRYATVIDLETGRQIWRNNSHRVRESTGISADGQMFLGKTMDGELVAVESGATTYIERWVSDAGWGYDHNPCPITVSEGVIYMANRLGEIAAFNEKTGELIWRAKFGNAATNKIVADERGNVYITLIEGLIYKIK